MAEQYQEAEDEGVLPHWYNPDSKHVTVTEGDGAIVYDQEGNEYVDFVSQLYCVNAGHSNEAIVDAMKEQLDRIQYVSSASQNDTRSKLAARLAEITPGDLSETFFAVSGSEANETAVQIAREYTDSHKVLTRWRSYHGSTYGAGSLTAQPSTRNTLERYAATTGAGKFLPPVSYRGPFDAETPEELAEQAADHLEFVIREEGPDSIAAILTEPVAGASGAFTAPPGYFERVREICDEYDVLLIADEVITGFGRCGDWFGMGTEGVEPDIMTFAKGVTSAYAPLAGVTVRPEIAEMVREGWSLGQTFGGHPVACAAGLAAIDEYGSGLIDNVNDLTPHLEERLDEIAATHDAVGDVRGRGFLRAIEFTDPETGEPFVDPRVAEEDADNPVVEVYETAKEKGALFFLGRPMFQITMAPPLCITEGEMDRALDVLDESIDEVF